MRRRSAGAGDADSCADPHVDVEVRVRRTQGLESDSEAFDNPAAESPVWTVWTAQVSTVASLARQAASNGRIESISSRMLTLLTAGG